MKYNSVKLYWGCEMGIMLDETDKAILRDLQEDASISNLNLSKKIGLSPSACLARTKNLVEAGIIKSLRLLLMRKTWNRSHSTSSHQLITLK